MHLDGFLTEVNDTPVIIFRFQSSVIFTYLVFKYSIKRN